MRILVTGASGQLGAYLVEATLQSGSSLTAWSGVTRGERAGVPLEPVELADPEATGRALETAAPDVIIHAAAISLPEAVRKDPERGRQVNTGATRHLAEWCGRNGRRLVFVSTDLVFDGSRSWYKEEDAAEPILVYGRTKRAAEQAILEVPGTLVARISLLYGFSRCGRESFLQKTMAALRARQVQMLFEDEFRTPIDYATAARLLVRLALSTETGLIHLAGAERISRYEMTRRAAAALGLDTSLVQPNRQVDVSLAEPRPADVSLDTSRLAALFPDLHRPLIEEVLAGAGSTYAR